MIHPSNPQGHPKSWALFPPFTDEGTKTWEVKTLVDLRAQQFPSCPPASQKTNSLFLLVYWIISFHRPACFISHRSYSFILPSSVLGGVKCCLEITHRYLELLYLHFPHLQIDFSDYRAGIITRHIKPSIFFLDINMKLHCAKPYDNYISLANIYCIFDILIIKQLNPSLQLDMNAWFFL